MQSHFLQKYLLSYINFTISSVIHVLCEKCDLLLKKFYVIYFQAAKKFVSGRKTMVSNGNLIKTPFVDEI